MLFLPSLLQAQECADCHDSKPASHTAHENVDCVNCHMDRVEYPHPENATPTECAVCHAEEADLFALGIHAQERASGNDFAPDCQVCHGAGHEIELPGTTRFRRATVETCGMCHTEEAEQFQQSVHGTLLATGTTRDGPTCNTCHGEHGIQRPEAIEEVSGISHIRETCASCHADVALMSRFGLPTDRVVSFDASFHGLALRSGSQTVANCGSCHGIHSVLPSSDPRSSVHPDNLSATCGSCHPGAGTRFQIGTVHQVEGDRPVFLAQIIEQFYLVIIPLTIGLMLLHHVGDWVRKTRARVMLSELQAPPRPVRRELRMYPAERLQHGLLVISFVILVWTGFALRHPDEFWAYPLVMWEDRWPVRGLIHRISAVVMIGAAVFHLVTLVSNRKLREHWQHLLPRRWDVGEAISGFAYNIGLRRAEPKISAHSYIEKVEYWAVVWGTLMMTVSGILLWADNFVLAYLPKGFLDVAGVFHYYEAVLAALAILVWHFYSVIFDPAVYPMNLAWLTGYGPARAQQLAQEPGGTASESAAQESGAISAGKQERNGEQGGDGEQDDDAPSGGEQSSRGRPPGPQT